ncbi:hypothetical protein AB0B63_07215 [Micromonospora sp. NPDC049081]
MSGQPSGRVTWDEKAGEYVQWHGRAYEVAHPSGQQKPATGETARNGQR